MKYLFFGYMIFLYSSSKVMHKNIEKFPFYQKLLHLKILFFDKPLQKYYSGRIPLNLGFLGAAQD